MMNSSASARQDVARWRDRVVTVAARVEGDRMTSTHVAVIGEAVADAFPQPSAPPGTVDLHVRPGGSPANTAVALARLGTPTRFLGRLATGLIGRLLRDHLAASGVDLSASVTADGTACLAVAAVDAQGRTSYDFYLDGATDWQWTAAELTPGRVGGAHCVHTGSLALVTEPGGPLIEALLGALRGRATISVDPNVRAGIVPAPTYRAGMGRWSRLADIVRLSDEDLAVLRPDGDFDRACADWHAAGVRLVVLTRGPYGAVASLDGTRVEVPAARVEVVDTVGAGDAFTAALVMGLLARTDFDAINDHANRLAAFVCTQPGATPRHPPTMT
jgi:fructokinase